MKSLEILEYVKNAPEFMGGDDRYKNSINSPIRYIEDIIAIKQDLKVLEIIRKKRVDVGYILALVTQYTDNLYVLEKYNGILSIPYQLTMEELLKLKQWLEENENELGN